MPNSSNFLVYNAAAGSGKTFTLVKEYLKIVLLNTDIFYFQKILAITFTNKAASEMKERILYNLQCFARKEETAMWQAIRNETQLNPEVIQKRSYKITEAILENYTAFNITTIDSFTHRIIRSFAYDFGLSLDFDVELDSKKVVQEAVDLVIDQIGINRELSEVLIRFSLQKSNDDKTWDIVHTLTEFADILLNESHKIAFQQIEKQGFSDYKLLQKNISNKQASITKELQKIGEKANKILKEHHLDAHFFNYNMLPKFFDSLRLNKDASDIIENGRLLKRFEENTILKKSAGNEAQQNFDRVYQEFYQLYLESERYYHQLNLLKLFKESIIPLAILSFINKALEKIKIENNIQLISEFNELIFKKIQNEPTPFIYERLGEKFRHYFIDEMQDTSILQWKNLYKLIDNTLSQEGGSLLLVGDAKQAIYRWRGGSSEQFIELADPNNQAAFHIPKKVRNLDTNYRSFSEIINFNNDFFQHLSVFLQDKTYRTLYLDGNKQKTNKREGGFVQIEFVELTGNTEEKDMLIPDKVLKTIESIQQDFNWNDMAVLVRKRKDAIRIADYLTENNIPIISSETLLLAKNPKVDFLINLMQFIYRKENKEPAIALLNYLHENRRIAPDKHLFFEKLIPLKQNDFFSELNHFGFNFELAKFHQKTLYESIEYSINAFNLETQPNAYLQYFLETLIDFENKKGSDLPGFLEYWELEKSKLSISIPEGKNAIRIMTIHKAKGLEFPVVIFPYDLDIYNQINPKIWYAMQEPEKYQNFKTLLIPYNKKLQFTDAQGMQLYQKRRETLELDNFNLLYVALTRAVEQLYIITDYKKQENTNYFSGLYIDYLRTKGLWNTDQFIYSFGDKRKKTTDKKTATPCNKNNIKNEEAATFINTGIEEHQIRIHTQSSVLWDTKQGKAISYGNLIHKLLAHIKTPDDIQSAIDLYISQGILEESQINDVKNKLYAVVLHPKLQAYFQQNIKSLNEREILTDTLEILIPDRLVFPTDDEVVIIDYKTGTPNNKHHKQINTYGILLQKMGFRVSQKLLVYIKEDTISVESIG